jgi:3'-5' exoribonuclease
MAERLANVADGARIGIASAPSCGVVHLSDLQAEQEAIVYALLVRKASGRTKQDKPYWSCTFRDRQVTRDAMIWNDHRFFQQAAGWVEGTAYRIHALGELNAKFGLQLRVLDLRPAEESDAAEGYSFFDLVEPAQRDPQDSWNSILQMVEKSVTDPLIKRLILDLAELHRPLLLKMQAASNMHHPYTGGLIEHVWSMTRVAIFLADHYARYYPDLDPPLNRSIIVAATILHDIGKLRELEYHPVEARYTTEGHLIGHILMGRDMVREAARGIPGFPEETLLLLEHAILAHHGTKGFGSPVEPQTIEALIVSKVDDLDAKVNVVAREMLKQRGDEPYTAKLYAFDNRRFYRGPRPEGEPPTDPVLRPTDPAAGS